MQVTIISTAPRRCVKMMCLIVLLCAMATIAAACSTDRANAPSTLEPTASVSVVAEAAIPANTPPAPSPDRAVLVALYNATDGANWYNNTNWLSDAPLSEWHGVTTTLDGRVAELSLRSNNLSGEIPAQLGDLANLKALDLAWNRLNGEIPTELSHLAELMLLDLGGDFSSDDSNELTGEIPPELGNLANLRALVLDDNQLTGEIPPELGNLTNLRSLSISHWSFDGCGHGRMTGEIPPELGNLTHLHQMRFNGNQLTGEIPTELGNLGNLGNLDRVPLGDRNWLSGDVSLDLSCNQLTGEIPSELGNLSGLHWLRLNDNELTGEIPATLGKLDTLEILELGNNRLCGCIPTALQDVGGINPAELGLSFCE